MTTLYCITVSMLFNFSLIEMFRFLFYKWSKGIDFARFRIGVDMKKHGGKCRFAHSTKSLDHKPLFTFAMPLNGPYNAMINRK